MADEDWALEAELQEKCLVSERKVNSNIASILPQVQSGNISEPAESPEKGAVPELCAADISLSDKLTRTHLAEEKYDVDYRDANACSIKSFEELNIRPELLKGLYAMGFNSPSKFQAVALPFLAADPPQNVVALSKFETGKTAAFILASLNRVDTNLKYPHVLVLSPSAALSLQVRKVAQEMARFIPNIEFCFAVVGEHLARGSKINAQFIIGTPGKVLDWGMKFRFFELKKIKVFVLIQANEIVSTQGYHDQTLRIHKQLPRTCQMLLSCTTYSEDTAQFAEQIVPDPVIIKLKREEESLD